MAFPWSLHQGPSGVFKGLVPLRMPHIAPLTSQETRGKICLSSREKRAGDLAGYRNLSRELFFTDFLLHKEVGLCPFL